MRSIGYDNIVLLVRLMPSEWEEIQRSCHYTTKRGGYALIPDKIYFSKNRDSIYCNLNIPKLINGNNVLLAEPPDLQQAIEKCNQLLPIPLHLKSCEVQSVDFTYTQDTPYSFELWKDILILPKRPAFKKNDKYESGVYLNSASRLMRVFLYSKTDQLRFKKKQININCILEHEHLLRAELRLDRKVRAQLVERGLWKHKTLLCSDLYTPEGFCAFAKLFAWRMPQFIREGISDRTSNPILEMVYTNKESFLKYLKSEVRKGKVSDHEAELQTSEILRHEREERPKQLVTAIIEECHSICKKYHQGGLINA